MTTMKLKSFISRNLAAIVLIPMLVGAHYGWYKLQHIDSLVTPEERNKLPITRAIENFKFTKD